MEALLLRLDPPVFPGTTSSTGLSENYRFGFIAFIIPNSEFSPPILSLDSTSQFRSIIIIWTIKLARIRIYKKSAVI